MARTSVINGKRVRPKLTAAVKRARRERFDALATDLAQAQQAYANEALNIAKKHDRSIKWTRSKLFMDSHHLRGRRRVNPWNAFMMAKLQEINIGRAHGERIKLPEYVRQNKPQLLREYRTLSEPALDSMVAAVQSKRDVTVQGARANPKAVNHTVTAAFCEMDREWTALCAKTGIEGFYVAVRGSIEDHSEPKLFYTEKAQNFVRSVLKLDPRRLGLQLESWVVSGIDVSPTSVPATSKRSLNQLVSECRTIIQDELDSILTEKRVRGSVKMNYNNYERAIVERYGVALTGWPEVSGGVRNPGKVRSAQINILLEALQSEKCKWVILTAAELQARVAENKARQARGENVYKARRRQATTPDLAESSDDD